MKDFIYNILTNNIVVNWLVPIITGVIVTILATSIMKKIRIKKDEKIIAETNTRYINAIRPFIIKKISISSSFITDSRNAILTESNLKPKYMLSEIGLRNKLIIDIVESKYINEEDKKELIEFTYQIFKDFESNNVLSKEDDNTLKKDNKNIKISLLIIVISELIVILISIFDKSGVKMEDNLLYLLPLMSGLIALIMFIVSAFDNVTTSRVFTDKIKNLFFEEVEESNTAMKEYKNIVNNRNKKR